MIYVRCINYSHNNVAKGIRLLDKKQFLFIQKKKIMQVRAFERNQEAKHTNTHGTVKRMNKKTKLG